LLGFTQQWILHLLPNEYKRDTIPGQEVKIILTSKAITIYRADALFIKAYDNLGRKLFGEMPKGGRPKETEQKIISIFWSTWKTGETLRIKHERVIRAYDDLGRQLFGEAPKVETPIKF